MVATLQIIEGDQDTEGKPWELLVPLYQRRLSEYSTTASQDTEILAKGGLSPNAVAAVRFRRSEKRLLRQCIEDGAALRKKAKETRGKKGRAKKTEL